MLADISTFTTKAHPGILSLKNTKIRPSVPQTNSVSEQESNRACSILSGLPPRWLRGTTLCTRASGAAASLQTTLTPAAIHHHPIPRTALCGSGAEYLGAVPGAVLRLPV
eukprot:3745520-Rhodomonas_salina.5